MKITAIESLKVESDSNETKTTCDYITLEFELDGNKLQFDISDIEVVQETNYNHGDYYSESYTEILDTRIENYDVISHDDDSIKLNYADIEAFLYDLNENTEIGEDVKIKIDRTCEKI
jgi:hypothetical protein